MATLELTLGEDVQAQPAQRGRRLGPLFWAAIGWVVFVFAAAVFADMLPLPSPTDMDMLARRAPFSAEHWLGTDGLGREELSRLVYGARSSLVVGLCAPVIGLVLGGGLGLLAGYFRGQFETLVVGSMDVLLAFPPLIFALAVTAFLGQSIMNLTCILGVLSIPAHAGGACRDLDPGATGVRYRRPGPGSDACAHPDPRVVAERGFAAAGLLPAGGCRHYPRRRFAGLPRPRRATADSELGQHDRRGA